MVILFDVSVRKSQYALTATFRSLKIDSNQMSAFGITTSGGKKNEDIPGVSSQVLSNYKWVIRIALLLVTCYLWDELIMSSRAYDMSLTPEWNMLVYSCLTGWYCFGFPTSGEQVNNFDDFMRVSFSWDLQPICKIVLASDNVSREASSFHTDTHMNSSHLSTSSDESIEPVYRQDKRELFQI